MKELLELAHSLKPFVVGAEGNVSCRIPQGFLIKASGTSLATLEDSDLVTCNEKGKQIDDFNRRPSIETDFHAWLYSFPQVNFIAHTHPINTLKILCSGLLPERFSETRLFPDQVVYNGMYSCVVPYAHPGEELLKSIRHYVSEYKAKWDVLPKLILLKNHGIICIGSTAKECLIATEICEKSAEIFFDVNNSAMLLELSWQAVNKIAFDPKEKYRTQ